MDQVQIDDVSRRKAIQRGLGAIAAVAIVWVGRGSAWAAPTKLAKAAVQYVDQGNVEGKDCDDCSQFVAAASLGESPTCRIVDGPISPHGHCIAFSPKSR